MKLSGNIKFLLLFSAVFHLFLLPAADMQIICDEETGICQLTDAAEVDTPVESGMDNSHIDTTNFTVSRRHLGYTGKTEFMNFLQNSTASGFGSGFWGVLLAAFVGGILLNLTPCVLPMLPVNLAIIGASGGVSGFRRGLLYGIGIAVVYGILGILAAFAGMQFGILNSSPWFNFVIALIFLMLSLAMAGVFTIDPGSKYRVNPVKLKFSKDMIALFMGGVSALLAGACVAPAVISVLLFASRTGWYGCFIPLALGIGMGLPWPLAGAGLSVLPKPGKFMLVLKYVFAVIIFLAAVYYAKTGIVLAMNSSGQNIENADSFTSLAQAMDRSRQTGKPVLVKFTASWCKNCHAMDQTTLRDPEVAEYMKENFIPVTFRAEDPTVPETAAILQKYEVPGFPAFVILQPRQSAE